MAIKNPPHPGRSIRENCLKPLGLSVTDAARELGVARHTLSRVLNGHAVVSPKMAVRVEQAGWSNAEFWLRRQAAYNLFQARHRSNQIAVRNLIETYGKPRTEGGGPSTPRAANA